MDIFVINLDRSTERLREFQSINSHLPHIKRFAAIEGETLDYKKLVKDKIFAEPITYGKGAIGNALSHKALWEITAAGADPITIVEDDAILHRDFEVLVQRRINEAPEDWDILVWGWNFDFVMSFDLFPNTPCLTYYSQNALRGQWRGIQTDNVRPALHKVHYAFGSIGYTLSPSGASKLLALAFPITPFLYKIPDFNVEIQNNALDCAMLSLYGRIDAYVCFPPLILTRNQLTASTVQNQAAAKTEPSFRLMQDMNFRHSRKFRKKYARYLFKKGDIFGGLRRYLGFLITLKKTD